MFYRSWRIYAPHLATWAMNRSTTDQGSICPDRSVSSSRNQLNCLSEVWTPNCARCGLTNQPSITGGHRTCLILIIMAVSKAHDAMDRILYTPHNIINVRPPCVYQPCLVLIYSCGLSWHSSGSAKHQQCVQLLLITSLQSTTTLLWCPCCVAL